MINYKRYKLIVIAIVLFVLLAWFMNIVSHKTRSFFNNSGREKVEAILEEWDRWEPQLLEHEIGDVSSEFDLLWQMSSIYVYQDDFGSCLAITDNVLVFLGGTDENDGVTLVGSDIETGAPRWKTDTRMMSSFAYDANHIYGDVNNGRVAAYDIMSGKIAWQVHLPRGNSILYTTATASDLYVEMIPATSYNLDLRTGGVKQSFSAFEGMPTFLIEDKIRFWKPRPESMQATNIETENTLWSAQFDGEIIQTPVFYEDFILVKTGRSTVGNIYVLDIATGEIIWQAKLVASNVSSSENVVYYLTTQAQLKAVDIRTGEMIGIVDFTPSLYELSPLDLSNRPFNVAAYDKTVVVYFGDSRQLFAFRFSAGERGGR